MRILDLFSGLGGWTRHHRLDHEVLTLDIDPHFDCDITADILEIGPSDLPWKPDLILASPPCEAFSVASIGSNWGGGLRGYDPTPKARYHTALVYATLALIESLQPSFAIIENPRGMLRKLQILDRWERVTVTYCQYGEDRMKPTDLWGLPFPPSWKPRPVCRPNATCHIAAPRGAKTGTQGIDGYAERSIIPFKLAREVIEAAEEDFAAAVVA
jgi:hypothetical protein